MAKIILWKMKNKTNEDKNTRYLSSMPNQIQIILVKQSKLKWYFEQTECLKGFWDVLPVPLFSCFFPDILFSCLKEFSSSASPSPHQDGCPYSGVPLCKAAMSPVIEKKILALLWGHKDSYTYSIRNAHVLHIHSRSGFSCVTDRTMHEWMNKITHYSKFSFVNIS